MRRLTKMNDNGIQAILTSAGVRAHLRSWGGSVAGRVGAEVRDAADSPGGPRLARRARVRVHGDLRREADTGYLSGSVGGGRDWLRR